MNRGIRFYGSDASSTVSGCTVSNQANVGIQLSGSYSVCSGNSVSNCITKYYLVIIVAAAGGGIVVTGGYDVQIINNEVTVRTIFLNLLNH